MPKFNAKKKSKRRISWILDRSQLPTAMYPHRALEKGKREVRNSCGLCFERIQKEYCSRVSTMAEQIRQNEAKESEREPKGIKKEPKDSEK